MKIETVDGIDWPVLEPNDCRTRIGDEIFPLWEDENGNGFYGYGHQSAEEFLAAVARYFDVTCGEDHDYEIEGPVSHAWAKFLDPHGDRFTWLDIDSETSHAFPMTIWEC